MSKLYLLLICSSFCLSAARAQVVDFVVEQVENEGKVPGKTYHLYARMTNENDQLLVLYGDSICPLFIRSSKPFYQHQMGGAMAKNALRKTLKIEPLLAYDSWITIGGTDNYDCAINAMSMDFGAFEEKGGAIEVPIDGAWFTLPTDMASKAGEDKKVLVGQFTTQGNLEGQFCTMTKLANGESKQQKNLTFKLNK